MHKGHKIKSIKRKAYAGVKGAKRSQYCYDYQRLLPQLYSGINSRYEETLQEGAQTSCTKGCFYCCYQHIAINLAHGILIVDYLYSHDEILINYINNYSQWNESVGNISQEIDTEFNSAIQAHEPSTILKHPDNPLITEYFDAQAPCPFLSNSCCSIYEVRPLCCAGHYSTSPSEWCSKNSTEKPNIMESLPTDFELEKIFTLRNTTPNLILWHIAMPIMVYELLVDGLPAFLDKLGIDDIFATT